MAFTTADRIEIHELLAWHGHLMDQGRLGDDDLGRLFVPDVRYDTTALGGNVLVGLAAIREAGLGLGDQNPVAHLVTNVVVTPDPSGDTAAAESKGLGVMTSGAVGSVSYADQLVRTSVGWRIRVRQVTPRRRPLQP